MKGKPNEEQFRFKHEQIETLKSLEDNGYIDLYFGDQSHFGLTPNVPYAWQTKDNPILLPAAKGKYQNVVGLMTRKNKLYFEILETTFNSDRIICFMNRFVEQTVKKTIVILDNSPILVFDAYKSFENLKEKLNFVLTNFGTKYDIKF